MRFRDLILFAKFTAYCIRHGLPTGLSHGGETLQFPDLTYVASYDITDLLFYQKRAALIREWDKLGNYRDKIKEECAFLNSQLERTWQGQYVPDHKPTKVGRKYDLITQSGLNEFAQAIMHNTGISFNFMATGDGTTDATLGDNDLEHERARMSMDEFGAYKTATGSVLRYGSFFIPGHETHLVCEVGMFSGAVAGTMMNRAVFSVDQRVQHTIFEDFFGVSLTVSMSSV